MDLKQLKYEKAAEKFLSRCDKVLGERVFRRVNRLLVEPYPNDMKILKGNEKLCRIRIGDYRVLYEVLSSEGKIIIHNIHKRSKVYRLHDEDCEKYGDKKT
jgi:mRNA interferase RelE/StbE